MRWLETTVRLNDHEYFLLDGTWYEGGTEYFTAIRRYVAALFKDKPSVTLPRWRKGLEIPGSRRRGEAPYNHWAAQESDDAFLNLDVPHRVRTGFHGTNGFEPCDLLGPGDELIHVKPAKSAGPLSHLFNQGLVSAEALMLSAEARRNFAALVRELSGGRRALPDDFRPAKVVFAIMIDSSYDLTPETLFPFAQIALTHVARTLQHRHAIEVEVVPIPRAVQEP